MDFYSIIISILHWVPGISLSRCVTVKNTNPLLPPPKCLPHPNPKNKNVEWNACMHAPTQPPAQPETTMAVAAEYNRNSIWTSDSTAFGRNILASMGWKEGGGIGKYQQGMTTNMSVL